MIHRKDSDTSLRERVQEVALTDAVARATFMSLIFSVVFVAYGFTSHDFIQRFRPDVTFWQNMWPRILLCGAPFLGLWHFMRRSSRSNESKLKIWILVFSVILHVTAWIYIWPIALAGSPAIVTYVHAANVYLFTIVHVGVGPPTFLLARFTGTISLLFILPLLGVIYATGDKVILTLVANDSLTIIATSIFVCRLFDELRFRLTSLEIEKETYASKFLGPVVSKAVFSKDRKGLETKKCRGFIVCLDLRNSTRAQQVLRERWPGFRLEYFSLVTRLVAQYSGHIQKTMGDGHFINFGVMDSGDDLEDIPGIEAELGRAEDRRLSHVSENVFLFVDKLFSGFEELKQKHLVTEDVFIGAGVDKGWVYRALQGDSNSLELDVNGDPVNCSARLQEYSKVLRENGLANGSVMVASPFATDYLKRFDSYQKLSTIDCPVRNFERLKWVLCKGLNEAATFPMYPKRTAS